MCLAHLNDNHFIMISLKDDCPIPPTSVLWRQHHQQDTKKWDERYVRRVISFNELSRAAGYEVVGEDDLYLVENFYLEGKVAANRKFGHEAKFEKDES
ncbi:hypothetical protein MTR_7g024450 [Medicago truncatula]|uniref:Uncharacterized protein n=1 Tax=Medicago truncatula TaxID=3880 RepID=G7KWV2_MEDTR|nr:hypothetical protein MTR_7g024450 [Medicago truncatula]